jgi:hypothetical protein
MKSVKDLGPDIWKYPNVKYSSRAYDLDYNGLTSLEGCPEIALHSLFLSNNVISSLAGSPKEINGDFGISENQQLGSLIGGPSIVHGYYAAVNCGLVSIDGIPEMINGSLNLSRNKLTSLQGITKLKEMNGYLYIDDCPITSHILGVLFIKGCKGIVDNSISQITKAANIVNRHIEKGRSGLIPCQMELIEAGLADFAQI